MGFEINPSFVGFRTTIPFCNGSLGPTSLVYDDVGLEIDCRCDIGCSASSAKSM